jgi:hypothetical protein
MLNKLQLASAKPKSDNPGKEQYISRLQDEIQSIKDSVASDTEYKSRIIEIHKPSNKIAITIKFYVGSQPVILGQPDINKSTLSRAEFNKLKGNSQFDKAVSFIESIIKDLSSTTPFDQAFKDAHTKVNAILDNARSHR